jgi:hypothetical protein
VTFGEVGLVLEGLEAGFAEGVVVGHAGPAEAAGDSELGQELSEILAAHGAAAVSVDDELPRLDAVSGEGLGE